jgi:hypothetical protein
LGEGERERKERGREEKHTNGDDQERKVNNSMGGDLSNFQERNDRDQTFLVRAKILANGELRR